MGRRAPSDENVMNVVQKYPRYIKNDVLVKMILVHNDVHIQSGGTDTKASTGG